MPRSKSPHADDTEVEEEEEEEEEGFLEGWCRVKTATPAVTRATTRYL